MKAIRMEATRLTFYRHYFSFPKNKTHQVSCLGFLSSQQFQAPLNNNKNSTHIFISYGCILRTESIYRKLSYTNWGRPLVHWQAQILQMKAQLSPTPSSHDRPQTYKPSSFWEIPSICGCSGRWGSLTLMTKKSLPSAEIVWQPTQNWHCIL